MLPNPEMKDCHSSRLVECAAMAARRLRTFLSPVTRRGTLSAKARHTQSLEILSTFSICPMLTPVAGSTPGPSYVISTNRGGDSGAFGFMAAPGMLSPRGLAGVIAT